MKKAPKDTAEIDLQDFDIEIRRDGRWFHEGGEIKRQGLVKLFASVLSCDDEGRYWLTTPVEKGEIRVEDAPFVIVSLRREGTGKGQNIYLTDNLDNEYLLSYETPLMMRAVKSADGISGAGMSGEARPYLLLDKGLTALIKHAVFYEMAELALEQLDDEAADDEVADDEVEEAGAMVLWSDGQAFSLVADEPSQAGH